MKTALSCSSLFFICAKAYSYPAALNILAFPLSGELKNSIAALGKPNKVNITIIELQLHQS